MLSGACSEEPSDALIPPKPHASIRERFCVLRNLLECGDEAMPFKSVDERPSSFVVTLSECCREGWLKRLLVPEFESEVKQALVSRV